MIDQRLHVVARRTEAAFNDELLAFFGMDVVEKEQRRMRVRRFGDETGVTDVGNNGIDRAPLIVLYSSGKVVAKSVNPDPKWSQTNH